MIIEKVADGPWKDCYRVEHGGAEMIVVADVGPRIISFKTDGGKNVLFDDSQGAIARESWRIWGGHRFWISPESEFTYEADNTLCHAVIFEERLVVSGLVEKSGVQKTLEITPGRAKGSFNVRHILHNTGIMLYQGAIWALTCVQPTGKVVIPWSEGGPSWETQVVRYWRSWTGSNTDVTSKQWQPRNGYFLVEPTGETGKIGVFSERGYIAHLRDDATFVKCYPKPGHSITYPDGGMNVELYTCGSFIELETLSPSYTFNPGCQYVHEEQWLVTDKVFTPENYQEIEQLF